MKPKRTIKTDNPEIVIQVMDDEGPGGANHLYNVTRVWDIDGTVLEGPLVRVRFQNGPVQEEGVNGIQDDDLLRIVVDRLKGLQRSKFSCQEGRLALRHVELALYWLRERKRDREMRGVEGKSEV